VPSATTLEVLHGIETNDIYFIGSILFLILGLLCVRVLFVRSFVPVRPVVKLGSRRG